MQLHRISSALRTAATLYGAFSLAGCAADSTPSSTEALDVGAASQRLLASIQLSESHLISFYELGPGVGSITEQYDLQADESSALRNLEVRDGELLSAYRQLAGARAQADALARLEQYELRRQQLPAPAGAQTEDAPPPEDSVVPYAGAVDKDRASEAHWFSGRFCDSEAQPDGCLGHNGSRYDWLPTDLPVCSTPVELCGTGFADPFRMTKKSNNIRWAAYNQGDTDQIEAILYLTDPCAHQSWWKDLTTVCKEGSLIRQVRVGPHAAFESIETSSKSWGRTLEVSGGHPIGVKMNVY